MRTIRNIVGVLFLVTLVVANEHQIEATNWVHMGNGFYCNMDEEDWGCIAFYTREVPCEFDKSGMWAGDAYRYQECYDWVEFMGYWVEPAFDTAAGICYSFDPFSGDLANFSCGGSPTISGEFTCAWSDYQDPCEEP